MTASTVERRWQEDPERHCVGIPTEYFDDTLSAGQVRQTTVHMAKAVCLDCPVKQQCLDWALATDEPWGVWGGLTTAERTMLKLGVSIRDCPRCRVPYVTRRASCPACGHDTVPVSAIVFLLRQAEALTDALQEGLTYNDIAEMFSVEYGYPIQPQTVEKASRRIYEGPVPWPKLGANVHRIARVEASGVGFHELTWPEKRELMARWLASPYHTVVGFAEAYHITDRYAYKLSGTREAA